MIKGPIIILANGDYPSHPIPLSKIETAGSIICCDGAAAQLIKNGYEPHIIIGDLDSIDSDIQKKYQEKLYHIPDQDENDLRKAIDWINKNEMERATILGATGKRDDHSLANIFTILQVKINCKCNIITDNGEFSIAEGEMTFNSFRGQQISIFSVNQNIEITSTNLKYNLNKYKLCNLYNCTLNESISDFFTLTISQEKVLVYQAFQQVS